ncbi:MAG: TadE/TadG family type IV pilus assembly protein [Acidimicrobiia bacterium]
MRRRLRRDDRGVTLTEFALLFGLLLMLAIGAFEYGMVFRDSLTVSTASREAGRVAASTANYGDADCVILEAAAGALQSLDTGTIDEIEIYKSSDTGTYPGSNSAFTRRYSPFQSGDPSLIACQGSDWNAEHLGASWAPGLRVNTQGDADWIGVRINYDHNWFTGFLWWNGSFALSDDSVFRIEPPAP